MKKIKHLLVLGVRKNPNIEVTPQYVGVTCATAQ